MQVLWALTGHVSRGVATHLVLVLLMHRNEARARERRSSVTTTPHPETRHRGEREARCVQHHRLQTC
ncbi:hypothetical protein AAFF_G00389820 [Aldrovandia affinis]|uniref:Uncharacterized protein n=1 Tax=Aldrovandia affinis TaxID=143900 RepID=A0AAD7WLE8_9TELE|nr:hypothetical protein AAFF_G00389820 [Aldrovandia affinis]